MAIDIAQEKLVSLSEMADELRRSYSSVRRWVVTGIDGHRLETIVVGGRHCTSIRAVQAFLDELTRERTRKPLSATSSSRHLAKAARTAMKRPEHLNEMADCDDSVTWTRGAVTEVARYAQHTRITLLCLVEAVRAHILSGHDHEGKLERALQACGHSLPYDSTEPMQSEVNPVHDSETG